MPAEFATPTPAPTAFALRPTLSVPQIDQISAAARAEALRQGWAVSIAVVDDGGHPLNFQRLDGAAPASAYIAAEKARTAALGRRESKHYEDMINGGRVAFATVGAIQGLLEGAVPIVVDGYCLGAIGVSGVRADQDAQIAKAGAAAVIPN